MSSFRWYAIPGLAALLALVPAVQAQQANCISLCLSGWWKAGHEFERLLPGSSWATSVTCMFPAVVFKERSSTHSPISSKELNALDPDR